MAEWAATFNAGFEESEPMQASFTEDPPMQMGFGQTQFVHTDDYNDLINKPQIESVTLQGNKTFKDLGMEDITPQDIDKIIFGG